MDTAPVVCLVTVPVSCLDTTVHVSCLDTTVPVSCVDTVQVVCLITVLVSCVETASVVCLVTVHVSCVETAPVVCLVTVIISCLDTAAVPGGEPPPGPPPSGIGCLLSYSTCLVLGRSSRARGVTPAPKPLPRARPLVLCCVFSSHPFWTSSSLEVPAGVTQEEGHTGFLIHLPSAVRALIFVARRIQPFLSLVDREVEFCVLTN